MPDFTVRSDSINVEQIMEQIRSRIREKRGVDYTEQQIQELAAVKLDRFLDPRGVRSDLLEQFRRSRPPYTPPDLPNYAFEEQTLFESHRGALRAIRRVLRPILKLFFNPNPLIQALNIQSRLNTLYAEREARNESARHNFDSLHYEVVHNLVVETTRLGIEVKNLKMRVESLTGRLEFNERRARALESVVVYKPSEEPAPAAVRVETRETRAVREPAAPTEGVAVDAPAERSAEPQGQGPMPEGPGQRSRRRRRRRGRRGSGSAAAIMGSGHGDSGAADGPGRSQEAGGGNDRPSDPEGASGDPDTEIELGTRGAESSDEQP